MTYSEYENRIKEVLSKPDTALTEIQGVLDELKKDITTLETLTVTNTEQEKRIKDLQDTNMKLFLSTGKEIDDNNNDPDEPAEGEAVFKEFTDKIMEGLDNGEE